VRAGVWRKSGWELVLRKDGATQSGGPDRFDEVAGSADIKWRTDELMALLRGED